MQGGWEAAPSAGGAENSALLHHHAPSSCHPAQLPALWPAVLLAGRTTVHLDSLPCPSSSIAQPKTDRRLSSKSHFSPYDCPSLPQPVKFLDWKCRDIPANRPFSGSISHLLSVLCVSVQILSHASVKKKTKGLSGFEFRTFNGHFQVTSHFQVKGLSVILLLDKGGYPNICCLIRGITLVFAGCVLALKEVPLRLTDWLIDWLNFISQHWLIDWLNFISQQWRY